MRWPLTFTLIHGFSASFGLFIHCTFQVRSLTVMQAWVVYYREVVDQLPTGSVVQLALHELRAPVSLDTPPLSLVLLPPPRLHPPLPLPHLPRQRQHLRQSWPSAASGFTREDLLSGRDPCARSMLRLASRKPSPFVRRATRSAFPSPSFSERSGQVIGSQLSVSGRIGGSGTPTITWSGTVSADGRSIRGTATCGSASFAIRLTRQS